MHLSSPPSLLPCPAMCSGWALRKYTERGMEHSESLINTFKLPPRLDPELAGTTTGAAAPPPSPLPPPLPPSTILMARVGGVVDGRAVFQVLSFVSSRRVWARAVPPLSSITSGFRNGVQAVNRSDALVSAHPRRPSHLPQN